MVRAAHDDISQHHVVLHGFGMNRSSACSRSWDCNTLRYRRDVGVPILLAQVSLSRHEPVCMARQPAHRIAAGGEGAEHRRFSTTPPASPPPAFGASPGPAPRSTAERTSPGWQQSPPLASYNPHAMDVDAVPAQPRSASGVGARSSQHSRPEPYSQSNGVLDDGDAADGFPGAAISYSPPTGARHSRRSVGIRFLALAVFSTSSVNSTVDPFSEFGFRPYASMRASYSCSSGLVCCFAVTSWHAEAVSGC